MESLTLELNVISANDLNKVSVFSAMELYVVVSLHDTSATAAAASKQKTPIDKEGGRNPYWNHSMKFTIDNLAAKRDILMFIFQILCRRNVGPDKLIGEVHVPVKDLLSAAAKTKATQFVSYQVSKPSGKPKGVLNLSFELGERNLPDEPVTAFPTVATNAVPGPSTIYPPTDQYPPPKPVFGFPEQYQPSPAQPYPPLKPAYGFPEQYPPPTPAEQYPPPKPAYGFPEQYPPPLPTTEQYPPPKPAYGLPEQYPPPTPAEQYPPPKPAYGFPEQYPPPPPPPPELYPLPKPAYGFPEQYPPPPAQQYSPLKPAYGFPEQYPLTPPTEQYPSPKPASGFPEQYPPPQPPTVLPAYPAEGYIYGHSWYPPQWAGVAGYGYPAQQGHGCGYGSIRSVEQPRPKKNNFGMGLGAGLLGGALAGLVL
ncbi:hypothetical protein Ancab_013555 [Ancistrocladus abbreviatus]